MSQVNYGSADAVVSRMPSPSIWNDCPLESIILDPSKGRHLFEDFTAGVVADATVVLGQRNGLTAYCESDDATDVALQADDEGTVILTTDATDADVTCIVDGDNTSGLWKTPTAGNAKGLWFEARIKSTSVTNGDFGFFVGLAQPGEAKDAGGCQGADAATLADVDYVGFAMKSGDADDLLIAYNEAGAGTAQASDDAIDITINTWMRVGFKVVTKSQGTYVQFYVDGEYLGSAYDVDLSLIHI